MGVPGGLNLLITVRINDDLVVYDSLESRVVHGHLVRFAERPELRHAGPKDVNREAELERPSRVACSDLLACVFLNISDSNNSS